MIFSFHNEWTKTILVRKKRQNNLIFFRNLRTKLAHKLLMSLCISLMSTLIIFLGGVEHTQSRVECQIVAGLLHYFLLNTFLWMSAHAFNLYRSFIKIFETLNSATMFLWKSIAITTGISLTLQSILK